jgi:hypothetical protein
MTSSTTHAPTPPARESSEPTAVDVATPAEVDVAAWDPRAGEPRHAAWSLHHSLEPRGRHRLKQSAVRPPAAALVSGLVYLATAGRVRVGHARATLLRSGGRRRAALTGRPEIPAQQGPATSVESVPVESAPVHAESAPGGSTSVESASVQSAPVESTDTTPAEDTTKSTPPGA